MGVYIGGQYCMVGMETGGWVRVVAGELMETLKAERGVCWWAWRLRELGSQCAYNIMELQFLDCFLCVHYFKTATGSL